MSNTIEYKGLTITNPDPTKDGGSLIQNNFKTIADWNETTSSATKYKLYDTYSGKGTTNLSTADSGQTWRLTNNGASGAGMTIINGKLTNTSNYSGPAAGYCEVELDNNVTKLGGTFSFIDGSGNPDNGVAVFLQWKTSIVDGYPAIPDSGCHLVISKTSWGYSVWENNIPTSLKYGAFVNPLSGGIDYNIEISIKNDIAKIFFPDGTIETIQDSRILSCAGPFAASEVFANNASTDSKAQFSSFYADDTITNNFDEKLDNYRVFDYIKSAINQLLPTALTYGPTPSDNIIIPAGVESDVSSNLQVTVKVPDSGKILIEMTAYIVSAGRVLWGVAHGANTYGMETVIDMVHQGNVNYMFVLSDLTPGEVKIFRWRHWSTVPGGTHFNDGSNGYFSTMKVTPIQ